MTQVLYFNVCLPPPPYLYRSHLFVPSQFFVISRSIIKSKEAHGLFVVPVFPSLCSLSQTCTVALVVVCIVCVCLCVAGYPSLFVLLLIWIVHYMYILGQLFVSSFVIFLLWNTINQLHNQSFGRPFQMFAFFSPSFSDPLVVNETIFFIPNM